jgi:ornithine cyclodeaminase/alanine dehydrogenase-like protein (mu-crystallin family)
VTLFLDSADITALATPEVTMAAARAAVAAEREGRTILAPRLDVDLPTGFLRTMPAAIGHVMGLKVMTLVKGLGTRYLVLVYLQETGELVAALDAAEITRLRTAATTALAGEMLAPDRTRVLALVGTGFEAEGHLRLLAEIWPLEEVIVYSRSRERRDTFASRMSDQLTLDVRAADSVEDAVSSAPLTVLATKSTEPVVEGSSFPAGAVVLSIGSTRPDLRELDRTTLARSELVLVDDVAEVCRESGDIIDALEQGALSQEMIVPMALMDGTRRAPHDGRDLVSFKSAGTAVHDLALALLVLEAARDAGRGRDLGELTALKPFADSAARKRPEPEPV